MKISYEHSLAKTFYIIKKQESKAYIFNKEEKDLDFLAYTYMYSMKQQKTASSKNVKDKKKEQIKRQGRTEKVVSVGARLKGEGG